MDKETPIGFIRQHAVESFKNDLVCGLEYPTPNPYDGKGADYETRALAWRTAYDDEKALCERMGEQANAREVEAELRESGVGGL